jgi:hypothetical protein
MHRNNHGHNMEMQPQRQAHPHGHHGHHVNPHVSTSILPFGSRNFEKDISFWLTQHVPLSIFYFLSLSLKSRHRCKPHRPNHNPPSQQRHQNWTISPHWKGTNGPIGLVKERMESSTEESNEPPDPLSPSSVYPSPNHPPKEESPAMSLEKFHYCGN